MCSLEFSGYRPLAALSFRWPAHDNGGEEASHLDTAVRLLESIHQGRQDLVRIAVRGLSELNRKHDRKVCPFVHGLRQRSMPSKKHGERPPSFLGLTLRCPPHGSLITCAAPGISALVVT